MKQKLDIKAVSASIEASRKCVEVSVEIFEPIKNSKLTEREAKIYTSLMFLRKAVAHQSEALDTLLRDRINEMFTQTSPLNFEELGGAH